jgi:hypothetical protein
MRALSVFLCILWAPFMRAQTLAIQHVTLIDATGKPAQPDMTLVVERDHLIAWRATCFNAVIGKKSTAPRRMLNFRVVPTKRRETARDVRPFSSIISQRGGG